MYGKLFDSTFTGSMVGAGAHVFAVWGYVIANTDPEGYIEINPIIVAAILGESVDRVQAAITYLTDRDPNSRNPSEDGRRLVLEGQYLYRVTTYKEYRNLRNDEERREYMKIKKREQRAREKAQLSNVDDLTSQQCQPRSTYAEGEEYSEEKRERPKKETATPPARKPASRSRDERTDHPAIQAVRLVTNRFPDKVVWDKLISELGTPDLQKLTSCHVEWVARGFKPTNLAWAFEWYKNGIPEKQNNGTNRQDVKLPTLAERQAAEAEARAQPRNNPADFLRGVPGPRPDNSGTSSGDRSAGGQA